MNRQRLENLRKKAARPVEVVFWAGVLGITALGWFLPMPPSEQRLFFIVALAASLYVIVLYHWIVPKYGVQDWVIYLLIVGAILFISLASYLLKPYRIDIELLYIGVVAGMGMLAGKRMAMQAALLSAIGLAIVTLLRGTMTPMLIITLSLQLLVILLSGYLVSTLADYLHKQIVFSDRQNRDLMLLLKSGNLATRSDDLRLTVQSITELVVKEVPATACRISLLHPNEESLETYGAYPLNTLAGWRPDIGVSYPLAQLPLHREALTSGRNLVLREDAMISASEQEFALFNAVRTVCLVPLISKGVRLGVLLVGEARSWQREPFNQEKLNLLQTLASQISGLIYNAQLYEASKRQADHLEVLNHIAKTISSTLELDKVLELIYDELQMVLPSDTYYVSLYDAEENVLDIRVMIDAGERFPPTKIHARRGLASWVIENRQPLLIRHLSKEIDSLPVKPIRVGQNRMSESWLGVPVLLGEQVLGMLAVASYMPRAFTQDDVGFLSSVASQAALAIDNARHHAEVEEQTRRDSLTQAYNHGYFLQRLGEEVERARLENQAVSLIMLDIDYFKQYNDTYGHVIGDRVLMLLVKAIQSHVKKSDIVGRWGGEEFAVALPGASTRQALVVAERIRSTLASLELCDREGHPIPKPTVSQGIATFPYDVTDAAELVDVADRALYQAKNRGRDQIMVAMVNHTSSPDDSLNDQLSPQS